MPQRAVTPLPVTAMLVQSLILAFSMTVATAAPQATATPPIDHTGKHGFDFQHGQWKIHHRVLVAKTGEWIEFDGTCDVRRLMDGAGNVEDHVINHPTRPSRAIGLRTYDEKTDTWAIWWVDGRNPHGALDPPVKGRFEADGVGRFYSDYEVDGKPQRVRYQWSEITATTAKWDQATSDDGGKTWDPNWVMQFQRVNGP